MLVTQALFLQSETKSNNKMVKNIYRRDYRAGKKVKLWYCEIVLTRQYTLATAFMIR